MLKSVTLIGSSSGRNAGDAALMSCIMRSVDKACGTQLLYEIPTIKPQFVRDNYSARTKPISILPWNLSAKILGLPTYQSIMRTDLTLIFDAILFDRSLYNPLFNFLSTLYLFLPMAKKKGKHMAFYNVGAGPVSTRAGQDMLRKVSNLMDFITTRDASSYNLLKKIGCTNPRMLTGADAALTEEPSDEQTIAATYRKLGLNPSDEILALNVNTYLDTWSAPNVQSMGRKRFVDIYSAAINSIIEKLDVPILITATQHQDVGLSREIMGRITPNEKVRLISNAETSHYNIKGVLSKVSLLFSMRLHALILASGAHVPIAGLAYQPKIDHYFKVLGMPEYSLSFQNFTKEKIADHVLNAWHNKDHIRATLDNVMPNLQKKSDIAAQLTASFHNGKDLEKQIERLKA